MTEQPEALRLADLLEPCCLTIGDGQQAVAAAELRRLHEENGWLYKDVADSHERLADALTRIAALEQALEHYEAALNAAFPEGASGAVFEHWNAARRQA